MSVSPAAILESAIQKEECLELHWRDGKSARFHFLWLRDNCPSNLHPHTQERVFDQLTISEDIHPQSYAISDDTLHIHWSEQDHRSAFAGQWLKAHAYSGWAATPKAPITRSWDNNFLDHIASTDYADLMTNDRILYQWMKQLDRDGLILARGMPSTERAINDFAQRIDYQRQTNFGVTFEVKNEADPINLAYTSLALPLHTDLPNHETPPGYQFLHCLINDCEGGHSVFADGLRILEDLRDQAPTHFELLAHYAIPFRFHDTGHDIRSHQTVINLDHFGNIVELKYNAHLAGSFDLPEDIMQAYYLAYRDLMRRIQSQHYVIKLKLQAGDMVVFDNRRVLHGRDAFSTTGRRHLHGCYVDRTEFRSRLRVLERAHLA